MLARFLDFDDIALGVPAIDRFDDDAVYGIRFAVRAIEGHAQFSQALDFGVTSEMDLGDPARFVQYLKSQVGDDCASFWSAGPLATVPGGHGAERDPSAPTLVKPSEAEAWVEARVREGSDYI